MAGVEGAFTGDSIHHALERYTVQSNSDWMDRMCEKAEPTIQVGNRLVIADDVKFERSASVHYCGLNKVFHYLGSMSIQVMDFTFSRIAPSLAETSECMRRAKITGSTACSTATVGTAGEPVGGTVF